MRIGGLDRFFQVNVNTLATIPLKGILVYNSGDYYLSALSLARRDLLRERKHFSSSK
jgi:hypothetical protein